ncbi:peptidyl-prolyl cis-trans isomerase [Aurantiacibacter flavus]|uniref:Parvulin-like PPIase n=1 Tax=Aurantiacibacter flavus TaxID=3145232 RepID=A0ABV0CZI4_9SPHN
MTPRQWLREPLFHFLLAGLAMFLLAGWWQSGDSSGKTIRLGEDDLLTFMQGRAQVYDAPTFSALLAEMSDEDRSELIRDAALQEVLYREAQALGLSEADPLVRQRMVQQMRLILAEETTADTSLSDADLAAFYEANKAQYAAAPTMSFTHVFLRSPATREEAGAMLAKLRSGNVAADQAGQHGERFLYQQNYAAADEGLVTSHFGPDFAEALFALDPGSWQGPIQSAHGWHVVLPLAKETGGVPDLGEVRDQVREDAMAERRRVASNAALDKLLASYTIELDDGL